jgi:hypothetical protein
MPDPALVNTDYHGRYLVRLPLQCKFIPETLDLTYRLSASEALNISGINPSLGLSIDRIPPRRSGTTRADGKGARVYPVSMEEE